MWLQEKQQKHLGTLASLRDSLLIAGSRTQAARTSKEEGEQVYWRLSREGISFFQHSG
jgi:hypothetical protein